MNLYERASRALHSLWSDAVGTPGHDKKRWIELSNALDTLARAEATARGVPRDQPLVGDPP